MKQHLKHVITVTAVLTVLALGAGAFAYSGLYNIGADDTHTKPVYAFMQTLREHSINRQARSIQVPDLSDPALIRQGAGNYNAMCTGCHLAPGHQPTELSKGLYPSPPALADTVRNAPAHDFWVIKHGIKASGMPAWGKSMQDQYIWGMVAFLQQLPKMDDAQFDALVGSSGGHSHGGGETMPHDEGDADHHTGAMESMQMDESKRPSHPAGTPAHDDNADNHAGTAMGTIPMDEFKPHSHPPGTPAHEDSAPAATTPKPAEDGHHHGH